MPDYPPTSLAGVLPVAARAERDARYAISQNTTLRTLLAPNYTPPAESDLAAASLRIYLGHGPLDGHVPAVTIGFMERRAEYVAAGEPTRGQSTIYALVNVIRIVVTSKDYQEASDIKALVLASLERKGTPHVHVWTVLECQYEAVRLSESTMLIGHEYTITMHCDMKEVE